MPIFALASNKGGAGKTTLALNLACGLLRREPTAILDADPQGSAAQWRLIGGAGAGLPAVHHDAENLAEAVSALGGSHAFLVIDCPPSIHAPQTRQALALADRALIPVQPSPMDLWATVHIARVIAEARGDNPGLGAHLVINQLEPRTTLSRAMREAAGELELPVTRAAVRRRAIYRNCVLEGRSVFDVGSRGREAAAEIDALIAEVLEP